MVTDCYRPEERNKVQAFNDFLIFGSMAIGSFISGSMLAHFGWYLVNVVMFPVVAVAGAMLLWLTLRERLRPAVTARCPDSAKGLKYRGYLRRCMSRPFLAISAPLSAGPGRSSRP